MSKTEMLSVLFMALWTWTASPLLGTVGVPSLLAFSLLVAFLLYAPLLGLDAHDFP